jgi:hypothetical protein
MRKEQHKRERIAIMPNAGGGSKDAPAALLALTNTLVVEGRGKSEIRLVAKEEEPPVVD